MKHLTSLKLSNVGLNSTSKIFLNQLNDLKALGLNSMNNMTFANRKFIADNEYRKLRSEGLDVKALGEKNVAGFH